MSKMSDELKRSGDAAEALASHLLFMEASGLERSVTIGGVVIKVSATIVTRGGDRTP